ncbi:MAG: type II secretion system F family protein, partial [Zavarzinella sp.]|nr:type II secretion system F family protein [Zavarzinella sp.]
MFAPRSSFDALASWSRAIRHGHGAGLTLVRVFEIQARSGPTALRDVAARIARKLQAGGTLEDALTAEGSNVPELFTALAIVGERSGRVPEVFGQLEEYYRLQAQLRREFRAQAAWPTFQFVGAVIVIALTIFLLGLLATGGPATAPVGFGLTGTRGAVIFLIFVGSVVGGLVLAYKLVTGTVAKQAAFEAWLLRVPVLGPAIQAAAMSRFCLALQLTLDSSMSTGKALRMSLRATGNGAFEARADRIVKRVEQGDEIARAIGTNPVFPVEFLGALSVGEVS